MNGAVDKRIAVGHVAMMRARRCQTNFKVLV